MELKTILDRVQDVLVIIAAIISMYFYYRNRTRAHFLLVLLLTYTVIINSIQAFFLPYFGDSILTAWGSFRMQSIYIEVGGYILIYSLLFQLRLYERIAQAMFATLLLIWVLFMTLYKTEQFFNPYIFFVAVLFTIICIFIFLYQIFQKTETSQLFTNFWFWISIGLFIFLAGETPYMGALNYLFKNQSLDFDPFNIIYSIKLTSGIFYYLTYLIALYQCRQRT